MTRVIGLEERARGAVRALFLVATLALAACSMGRDTAYMKPLSPGEPTFRSDPQMATLIFGQAHRMVMGRMFTILDENGKFVGDIPGKSAFAITVAPGRHVFVLVSFDDNQEDLLYTDMRAGGVYYVDVIDGKHPLTERRMAYFWPAKHGGDPLYTLSNLPEHLENAKWNTPDVEAGNRFLATHALDIQGVMKDANEQRAREEKTPTLVTLMHTLGPEDALPP